MGSRLSTDARLMTSTTLLIRGSPLAAINRRSRASAEPRYRAGSFPSALYPVRVDRTAELAGHRCIAEAHDAHAFPRGRVSLAARAMANRALRFKGAGALFICIRWRTQAVH